MGTLKKNDAVVLGLKEISEFFHPLLKRFDSVIISATNEQIIIPAPVKNASTQTWAISRSDIDLLLLKVDDEKSNLN